MRSFVLREGGEVGMNTRDAARILRRKQTPAEARLWAALRRHQVDGLQFRRQEPIGKFIADFYCHQKRVVVEVDGPVHLLPDQIEHDREREELFTSLDLRVLRVTNDQVFNDLEGVIAKIRSACES
jgi:very-short-patch-repair endonuclease